MAIDLRQPGSPYINFSVTQDPTIPLGGQGGEVGADDADPGASREVWPGWEQVKGANNQTYWQNVSDTNWPVGTWLDPRSNMAMDPTSGEWKDLSSLTRGATGGQSGAGDPNVGFTSVAPAGTAPPTTGKPGQIWSVYTAAGEVQQYLWNPKGGGVNADGTDYNGGFEPSGAPRAAPKPAPVDDDGARIDSPAQTVAAQASATSAAASMTNAQTNKDQLAAQIAREADQLAQAGDQFQAQLIVQKGIALGVLDGKDTLQSVIAKHQMALDLDRFGLDKSKFDWTKVIDDATLTGYYKGEPTLTNLIQTAGLTGFYKDKPTLAKIYGDADRLGVLNGQPILAAKELGLRADLGYADSRRADTTLNLGQQNQAYNQFAADRQFQLDLMRDPESYVAAAFMGAGREAPKGTALADQLADLNARRPLAVDDYLHNQAGYKPTEPPPGAGLYNPPAESRNIPEYSGNTPATSPQTNPQTSPTSPAAAQPQQPQPEAALAPAVAQPPTPPANPEVAAQPPAAATPAQPPVRTVAGPRDTYSGPADLAPGAATPTTPRARMLTLDPFAEPEPTAVHAPALADALAGSPGGAIQNNVFGAPTAFERTGAGSLAMPAPKPITVAGPRDTYSGPAAMAPGAAQPTVAAPVRTVAGPRDTYSGPASLAPGAQPPATLAGPRKLNLADIRNTGMMPPQLDQALTPIGTGPGTRGKAAPGSFGWKPPGGLRPMSRQSFHALQPTEQRALRGTVSSLGGKSAAENYLGDIDRRSRGLRQRL
jgi:hypothetical protein